jgi:hypothetical protein
MKDDSKIKDIEKLIEIKLSHQAPLGETLIRSTLTPNP